MPPSPGHSRPPTPALTDPPLLPPCPRPPAPAPGTRRTLGSGSCQPSSSHAGLCPDFPSLRAPCPIPAHAAPPASPDRRPPGRHRLIRSLLPLLSRACERVYARACAQRHGTQNLGGRCTLTTAQPPPWHSGRGEPEHRSGNEPGNQQHPLGTRRPLEEGRPGRRPSPSAGRWARPPRGRLHFLPVPPRTGACSRDKALTPSRRGARPFALVATAWEKRRPDPQVLKLHRKGAAPLAPSRKPGAFRRPPPSRHPPAPASPVCSPGGFSTPAAVPDSGPARAPAPAGRQRPPHAQGSGSLPGPTSPICTCSQRSLTKCYTPHPATKPAWLPAAVAHTLLTGYVALALCPPLSRPLRAPHAASVCPRRAPHAASVCPGRLCPVWPQWLPPHPLCLEHRPHPTCTQPSALHPGSLRAGPLLREAPRLPAPSSRSGPTGLAIV